jgi:hypothetical protein
MSRAIARDPKGLLDAVHICSGSATAGCLSHLGAKRILFHGDALAYGPCSSGGAAHGRMRLRFWKGFQRDLGLRPNRRTVAVVSRVELARGLRAHRGLPIVVWAGYSWNERLFLWWVADALARRKAGGDDVWLVVSGERDAAADPLAASLGAWNPEDLLSLLGSARPFARSLVRAGARMWAAFTRKNPRDMEAWRSRGGPWPMGPILAEYASLFPRLQSEGSKARLRLSELDQYLGGSIPIEGWSRPLDLIKRSDSRDGYLSFMASFGDLIIPRRLRQLATNGLLLQSRPLEGKGPFTNVGYRLTAFGEEVVAQGLRSVTDVPPIYVGGCIAYDLKKTWAVARRGSNWGIVRWVPPAGASVRPTGARRG